jgi:hypothetical protein
LSKSRAIASAGCVLRELGLFASSAPPRRPPDHGTWGSSTAVRRRMDTTTRMKHRPSAGRLACPRSSSGGTSARPCRGQPPLPKPILHVNGSREADDATALLERYGIDFEIRETHDPLIALHWKHTRTPTSSGSRTSSCSPGGCCRSFGKAAGASGPSRAREFPCAPAEPRSAEMILRRRAYVGPP